MATRVNRKSAANQPKEVVNAEKTEPVTDDVIDKTVTKPNPIGKRLAKKNPKIVKKNSLALKLKAKGRITRLNPLTKNVAQRVKAAENKKKILANAKKKMPVKKGKEESIPVLEPIFPIEENNIETKKTGGRKKATKKAQKPLPDLIDVKKIKVEPEDDISLSSDFTDISNQEIPNQPKQVKKGRGSKKVKPEADSLEDIMNDLTYLIKEEPKEDSMSESGKSETAITKPKKLTKKQRIDLLKKTITKKENIENTLNKLDSADEKVIDMLDLNVRRVKRKTSPTKRRHSIEKFSMATENVENAQITLFQHLPRSISPRSKVNVKLRGIDSVNRRINPYTTRSDSPARMLRNGKQRKLKDMNLFEGLDAEVRKRRRLCSDISEISASKLSGYESDSSFSDMASSHGTENADLKDLESKVFEEADIKPPVIKTTCDGVNGPSLIDTNSNVCTGNLNDNKLNIVSIDTIVCNTETVSKVPEKSIILDIMKQNFNEVVPKVEVTDSNCTPIMETIRSDVVSEKSPVVHQEEDNNINDAVENTALPEYHQENQAIEDVEKEIREPEETSLSTKELNDESIHELPPNDSEKVMTTVDYESSQCEDMEVEPPHEPVNNETENSESNETSVNASDASKESVENDETLNKMRDNVTVVEMTDKNSNINETDVEMTYDTVVDDSNAVNNDTEASFINSNNKSVETNTEAIDGDVTAGSDTEQRDELSDEQLAEALAEKESILKALGLQSLKDAEQVKQKSKDKLMVKGDSYTGTLKTVIKINRDKKKGRKMNSHKIKGKTNEEDSNTGDEAPREHYKVVKEASAATWKQSSQSSDSADGSSEHTSDGESVPVPSSQEGVIKALVIPEKASSFSIHPGRLCKDECSYCFGKFGLFDTPCHIAQMKSIERQDKILKTEVQLTRDSCLCDACYRHVDRKANTPSYTNKSIKRNSLVAPGPRQNHCHVLGCNKMSTNILRRKWIIKMRKSICQVINIDLDNPGLHSIPICDEHYAALEHLMLCAMCKRRLAKNHIHYLGPETSDLNQALNAEGLPISLSDKPVVCKLCRCFASILLKDVDDRPDNSVSFFKEYKKRLLHFNDIVPMDEAEAEEPISVPGRTDRSEGSKKKKKSRSPNAGDSAGEDSGEQPERIQERVPSSDTASQPQSRSESPIDEYNGVDYNTLIPAIAMDCGSDTESKKETSKSYSNSSRKSSVEDKPEDASQISELAVQKLGANPSISVRQLFPGEEDLPLTGHIDFQNVKDRTPEGWEKCNSTIQYDLETKKLWSELQKPYGNQSSFMRHLILLEKYFRNGDLVLSPRASHHSINYSESVHNRLRAYDNIPSSASNIQPISMIPFNKIRSSSGIITSASSVTNQHTMSGASITSVANLVASKQPSISVTSIPSSSLSSSSVAKNSPITLSQLNSPPLIPNSCSLLRAKSTTSAPPPGLMPLHPGTTRPMAPLVKIPQPQKIKFPITKNWRPNLIPIDPTKKIERKNGLVQVISGGKPYHITLEDYKKMCAIKRSFEMKQKRLQEAQSAKPILVTHNSVLKSIIPRKGLIISKTSSSPSITSSPPNKPEAELINGEGENILDKLDKQVEKLESRLNESGSLSPAASLLLPKIPKSLTVIPQTVARKPSRPSSPVLMILPKNKS